MEVEQIKKIIVERMAERGHTYATLGEILGTDKGNIYNRINKRKNMTYASLKSICDVLSLKIKITKK